MFDNVDPELEHLVGDFHPSDGHTEETLDEQWKKFKDDGLLRAHCVEPPDSPAERRFAKAHSSNRVEEMLAASNPWKAAELAKRQGGGNIFRMPLDVGGGGRLAKREALTDAGRALNNLTALTERAKAGGYVPSGSITEQVNRLMRKLIGVLTPDETNQIVKAIECMDFACALTLLNRALEATA